MGSFTGSNCKTDQEMPHLPRIPVKAQDLQGQHHRFRPKMSRSQVIALVAHGLCRIRSVGNTVDSHLSHPCTVASLANESFKLLETRSYLSLTNEKQRFVLPEPGMLEVQLLCCSTAWVASADMTDCQGVKSKGKKLLKMQNVTGPN